VSSINQDPIVAKFQNNVQQWCRVDYEVTPDDSQGYGLIFNSKENSLYGVFSSTGTQGTSDQDFRKYATKGWFTSYGQGGGGKISVIAKIDPSNGNVLSATFVSAVLSSGNSNSVTVTKLTNVNQEFLCLEMSSFFSPRKTDKKGMTCSGSSPFRWNLVLSSNLSMALSSCADDRCTASTGCLNTYDCGFSSNTSTLSFSFILILVSVAIYMF
jgi:hypothetical protein